MEPVSVVLGIGALIATAFAVYLYGKAQQATNKAARLANDKVTLEKRVEELGQEIAGLKPALEKAKRTADTKKSTKLDHKRQNQQLKDEVKTLREKLTGASTGQEHVKLRAEIAEAMNTAEELRHRAKAAELELEELRQSIDAVTSGETDSEGLTETEVQALRTAHESRLREAADKADRSIGDERRRAKVEMKAMRDQLQAENKKLRSQTRKASRESEQQRRRAENNDRAYTILQLQLDAALEKLALLDPSVRAPGGFYDPEVEAQLKAAAEARRKEAAAAAAAEAKADEEAAQQEAAAAALATAAAELAEPPQLVSAVQGEASDGADEASEGTSASEETPKSEETADGALQDVAAQEPEADDAEATADSGETKATKGPAQAQGADGEAAEPSTTESQEAIDDSAVDALPGPAVSPPPASDPNISLDSLDDGWSLEDANLQLLGPSKLKKTTPEA